MILLNSLTINYSVISFPHTHSVMFHKIGIGSRPKGFSTEKLKKRKVTRKLPAAVYNYNSTPLK